MEKMTEDFIEECKKLRISVNDYKDSVEFCEKMAKSGFSLDVKQLAKMLNNKLRLQIVN